MIMTNDEAATILYKEWQRFLENNLDYAGISDAYKMAINTLKQEPIVHAKWVKYCEPRCEEQHYQCTNCKDYVNFGVWGDYYQKDFRYCPHCGAKMAESEE